MPTNPTRARHLQHPDSGPARPTPRPAEPAPIDPTRCHCQPVTVGTFRDQKLVAVERRHMRRQGCVMPPEPVDVTTWRTGR